MRQVVLADHDFDVHAEVIFTSEDLDHLAARILRGRGPIGNLDIDHDSIEAVPGGAAGGLIAEHPVHTFPRRAAPCGATIPGSGSGGSYRTSASVWSLHSWRDHDFLADFLIDRGDEVVARTVMKGPDHGRMGAIDRPDDSAFGATVGTDRDHFDQHLVAVHCIPDERWGDKDISSQSPETVTQRLRIRQHEPVAVPMHAEAADNHVLAGRCGGQSVPIGIHS